MSTTSDGLRRMPRPTESMPDRAIGLPMVSVIVPTRNRGEYLPHLFAALACQVYPANLIELLVVDNDSDDETEAVIGEWQDRLPFPLRYHRKVNDGPAASRNVGGNLAAGQVLAYTDSDCIPDMHWLANAVRSLRADCDLVAGPMIGLTRSNGDTFERQYREALSDDGMYPTGNLVLWRSWFDVLGGFDERYGIYPWGGLKAGEDTDFAWRARRRGAQLRFVEDVVVGHQPAPAPTTTELLLAPLMVQIVPHLVAKIPELRDTRLWHRYFLDELHFRFDVAAVSVVLAVVRRQPALLLGALPWLDGIRPGLGEQWNVGGPKAFARLLGVKVHCSVLDALVLAFASARYRRLVL